MDHMREKKSSSGASTQRTSEASSEQPQSRPLPDKLDLAAVPSFQPPSTAGTDSQGIVSPTSVSGRPTGHPSASSDLSGDAVFPIRSVVSVDPSNAKSPHSEVPPTTSSTPNTPSRTQSRRSRHDTTEDALPTRSSVGGVPSSDLASPRHNDEGPISSIQADAARQGTAAAINMALGGSDAGTEESGALGNRASDAGFSDHVSLVSEGNSSADVPNVAARFTYVQTDEGHAVITGTDGVLQQCEDEPIHTPGAVQGFGAMLALHEEPDGRFTVRYVSENSERLVGYSPRHLFRLKNFIDILTEEQQDNLLDHIDFVRDEDADPAMNGPELLSLSIRHPKLRKSVKLWCAIHINAAHPDLIICEFELDDDEKYPLRPPDEVIPEAPTDTLDSNPTREELDESTEIWSKPLRILRSARRRRGEQGAMQVFDVMSQIQEQLATASNLQAFLKILVGIVKELTGFHRVMVYQFDSSFNGKVVTEVVDTMQTKDLYNGLHFPASDIPRQARELYKINKVRLLYDRDLDTARIVCRSKEDLETPLDMTHAYLRAMSPIHLKYLSHMSVRSSMSISINAFNELWGLISCHSYGGHGMRVSFPIRKMCRLVGETASRNIERLSYASRLQARKLINTAPTDKNPSGYIIASSDDLLKLFDADFGLLSIKDETKVLGVMQQSQEALALLEYLRMRQLTSVTASQDIKVDFPDLRYTPGFQVIAGLMYVPLSVGGSDFIVFFRKGQIREVQWAGNPYEKIIKQGTAGYLEPRSSFKAWHELVLGKCREWSEEQVETAAVLCLVYGKFIEIWRQKEAALQNSNLTRLLLANSAHEVRTPLNAIINYLEIALEGNLDNETRDNLMRSHAASKSLVYVINDLLDLTKIEEGQNLVTDEVFDLQACIDEATEPFRVDASRKGLEYQVVCQDDLPQLVHGDSRRLRQAISNITANAVSHTDTGSIKIEVVEIERSENHTTLEFIFTDTGRGMDAQKVDGLFRDLEQVSTVDPHLTAESGPVENAEEMRTLGLGLAVVGRIVRNMDGQLRLKSEVGSGSRFVIQLPFDLADPDTAEDAEAQGQPLSKNPSVTASTGLTEAQPGEVTLVKRDKTASLRHHRRDGSAGSGSRHSGSRRSGSQGSQDSKKSDADRLIDAIQTPLARTDQYKDRDADYFHKRRHSRGSSGKLTQSHSAQGRVGTRRSIDSGDSSQGVTIPQPDAGHMAVRDSQTPIKPVKVPDSYGPATPVSPTKKKDKLVEITSPTKAVEPNRGRTMSTTSAGAGAGEAPLQILIAEDDPINLKILQKRLERAGHQVYHAVNGRDCATLYREKSPSFDLVLMDMQMPIADGLESTKMIREIEASPEHAGHSEFAQANGRIPIFAVSASLEESKKDDYVNAGFDGWILKPIDFSRLSILLAGIQDQETRRSNLYSPGEWEKGGWFIDSGHSQV